MRTVTPAFRSPRAARLLPVVASVALAFAPSDALATTYPVSNTAEFIAAINSANFLCPSDPAPLIQATGPFTISTASGMPSFGLPTLYCPATIDGGGAVNAASTNGFDTQVTLNGAGTFASCGLTYDDFTYGGRLTVQGMKVENFTYGSLTAGICGAMELHQNLLINNSVGALANRGTSTIGDSAYGGNVIIGNDYGVWVNAAATIDNNKIGTPDGSTASGNGYGVYASFSSGTTVSNNLISGNSTAGVYFDNDYGGTVSGNYIGTTADGDGQIANGTGVYFNFGGNASLDDNIISGNTGAGVVFNSSTSNTLDSNTIGIGFSLSSLPNNRGVEAFCSGYIDLFSNTISANSGDGVFFDSTEASFFNSNTITANGGDGVRFTSGSCFQYGSFNQMFDNDLSSNGKNGVLMTGLSANNSIQYGRITANGVKNISINGGTAPLPNDAGDGDGGPNHQQNYPVLTAVVQDGSSNSTTVTFDLDSSPTSQFIVQFYANPALGTPGGDQFLGSAFVYGGTTGNTFTYFGGLVDNISGTATLQFCCGPGETSEFSPMKAALTAPSVRIGPTSKDFGFVTVDGSSAPTTFTLLSIGDQPYVISDIQSGSACYPQLTNPLAAVSSSFCIGGAFTCSTTCAIDSEYAKNQSCSMTVRFTPTFLGTQSDTICIFDNTSASPHSINLSGTATPPPPLVMQPTAFDFGDVPVGTSSETMRFKVTNQTAYGSMPVTVTTSGGEFDIVADGCSPAILARTDCDIDVAFAPSASGGQLGALVVTGSTPPPSLDVSVGFLSAAPEVRAELQGVGVSGGQLILPNSIDMGGAQVGGTAITYPVELRNTGNGTLTLSTISASSPFTLTHNCPATLAPEQACLVTLSFTATSLGEVHGTLTIVSSAEGGSREIPVTARGQTVATPLLRVVPVSLGFGSRVIGSQSTTQQVTITNIGGATATLDLSMATIDFLISGSSCGGTLLPQASCSANVSFRPLGFGTRPGFFLVTGNAANSPQSVSINGTGCRPFTAGGSRFSSASSCEP